MGPWSILAAAWLPLPAIFGLKGHSLVFDTGTALSADALFIEYREATGALQTPEVFPRTDGTTYVCGISGESPLPIDPADVAPDPGAIERLQRLCHDLSPALASPKIVARQACYRPITRDGLAADRPGAGRRGRLHRHRPQRLGHSECAGDRRGHGRIDRRRRRAHGRPVAFRTRPASHSRSGASAVSREAVVAGSLRQAKRCRAKRMSDWSKVTRPIPVPNEWTKPFWDAAKRDVLELQRCQSCGHFQHPPYATCTQCVSTDLKFEPVRGARRDLRLHDHVPHRRQAVRLGSALRQHHRRTRRCAGRADGRQSAGRRNIPRPRSAGASRWFSRN